MRHRQERLLSVIETSLDAALGTDDDLAQVPNEAAGETATPLARSPADLAFTKPDELTWWDWTVFLLHTAAEIEHALMVQYLYAAYSLREVNFQGPNVPPDAPNLAKRWRRMIAGIAREEMGHLITVQNLLRFIGGTLNFEREDFPFRTFYPFRFQLEPLTRSSLAKYVAAEMPEKPDQLAELMREIVQRATGSAGGSTVNQVGPMYAELVTIFEDSTKLSDDDLSPETADGFQAKEDDWRGSSIVIVRELRSRADAVNALVEIGEQGEGSWEPTNETDLSHFDRFIQIYQEYPETDVAIEPVDWIPTHPVPTNPNTLTSPSSDALLERGRITHPLARLWAQLSNVRYRMLLLSVVHALYLKDPMEVNGSLTVRGHLCNWAFIEMRGELLAGLSGVSKRLVQLPLKEEVSPQEQVAALPFELPYTLALPDRDPDRWRLHLALTKGARGLIEQIEGASGSNDVLEELKDIDLERQRLIEAQL
jgi:hypothetical protein